MAGFEFIAVIPQLQVSHEVPGVVDGGGGDVPENAADFFDLVFAGEDRVAVEMILCILSVHGSLVGGGFFFFQRCGVGQYLVVDELRIR